MVARLRAQASLASSRNPEPKRALRAASKASPARCEQASRMAKKSQIHRDKKRKLLIAKYAEKRAELRKRLNDASVSIEDKLLIQEEFSKLPRNSCPTRLNRRCEVSGRSRSYYRKFGISRIALRDLTLRGQLPGMRKSSW